MKFQKQRGAALVVTLIVLTALAVVAVAMLTNTSIDKATVASSANIYRAQLAAEAGLNVAIAKIESATRSDDFIVATSNATLSGSNFPVNYIGVPNDSTIVYTPLFSGGETVGGENGQGLPIDQLPSPEQAFASPPTDIATNELPVPNHLTANGSSPINVAWVPITNSEGAVVAKYAYWAEDLGAYLDADVSGSKPLVRGNGTQATELGIFTLFRPEEKVDSNPSTGLDYNLIQNRTIQTVSGNMSVLFSGKTLGFLGIGDGLSPNGTYTPSDDYQQYFATKLASIDEPQVVPRGFGYASAGEPKKNINELVQLGGEDAVEEIAEWIQTNLPNFSRRAGSFPASQNYFKTIAANIIDYADTDNGATVGNDYRGVDSYPFVTQFYQQFTWVNEGPLTANPWIAREGTWQAKIRLNVHLQLWNPSNQTISSGSLRVDLSQVNAGSETVGQKYAAYHSGSEIFQFKNLPPGSPANVFTVTFSNANQMQPNQYLAWSSPDVDYWLDTGISSSQPAPGFGGTNPARPYISVEGGGGSSGLTFFGIGYRIFWNDKLVDQPGSITHASNSNQGFEAQSGRLDRHPANGGNGPTWRGGQPGLRHGNSAAPSGMSPSPTGHYLLGDPRGTFYLRDYIQAHDYDENASWWGRHKIPSSSGSDAKNHFYAEARLRAWPDGAHETNPAYGVSDTQPGDSAEAVRAKNSLTPNQIPNSIRPALVPSKAPAKISNSGNFTNILELGNVYDPICWKPTFTSINPPTFESAEKAWREVGIENGTMIENPNYTIPSTLRIGRHDYFPFDQVGRQASQLLDLLTINATTSTKGKININTASREVLRALGAGIIISSDPDIMPIELRFSPSNTNSGLAGPFLDTQADKLADAIIQSRPFVSTAQLSNLKLDERPFFGNPKMWDAGAPTAWNDSAAEEYFREMFGITSVRNRNFRIYVVGLALNPINGKILSKCSRVYQIFMEPNRNQQNTIESQTPNLISIHEN